MKKLLILFLVVAAMLVFSACSMEEEMLITSHTDPNGNYTVCLYQVGSPQWSFGSVNAKLVLQDAQGQQIDEESFGLANDGAGVFAGNMKEITWLEDRVEIVMGESDTTKRYTYVLSYAG
ncbi:MAG: hypothetical protein IJN04_01280 [Clostridia bacterium]|nr:hypothetical protein [Clostridia bacterium]